MIKHYIYRTNYWRTILEIIIILIIKNENQSMKSMNLSQVKLDLETIESAWVEHEDDVVATLSDVAVFVGHIK